MTEVKESANYEKPKNGRTEDKSSMPELSNSVDKIKLKERNKNIPQPHRDIFDAITKGEIESLKTLLATNDIKNIDFLDEIGMTPLQHACYKGNMKMAQIFLDKGADVNIRKHEHQYTTLHFAALSGNADLCHLLLCHGVKPNSVNTVSRTAAQMAGFVGNHKCAATINNFVPKANIDCYIKCTEPNKEPLLKPYLADSFHFFISETNIHPVKILMGLRKHKILMSDLHSVQKVLEAMSQHEMSQGFNSNEIMSFKYHLMGSIVSDLVKTEQQIIKSSEDNSTDKIIEYQIKRFLNCNCDGVCEYRELYLKDVIRNFGYKQSAILSQMVATLTGPDPPSALAVILAAINGQRGANNSEACETCGEDRASKKCSKCKSVQYCDKECQRLHWFLHKKVCGTMEKGISDSSANKIAGFRVNEDKITTSSIADNQIKMHF